VGVVYHGVLWDRGQVQLAVEQQQADVVAVGVVVSVARHVVLHDIHDIQLIGLLLVVGAPCSRWVSIGEAGR
jgi:hypothetical protein